MSTPIRYTKEMIEKYFREGYWTEDTTCHLWDRNAEIYPDKEAFVSFEKRLTWSQLKLMSDRLAIGLLEIGLKKDDIIFLLLPNCCESYIARTACEKAGIVCATAMMTLRERECQYLLENLNAVATIIPQTFRSFDFLSMMQTIQARLPKLKYILTTGTDELPGSISIEKLMQKRYKKMDCPKMEIKATDVSVIACTSGTTGLPKTVEHAQCARMALARNYQKAMKITSEDIILNIVSGIAGLGAALCYNGSAPLVGAKSVLLESWTTKDTFRLIEKEKATVLFAVPAQLAQLTKDQYFHEHDLNSLRCIVTATSPLSFELATEVEELFGVPILNNYGQLDGGLVSYTRIEDPPEVRRRTVGRPADGVIVKLIDRLGKEAAKGEIIYSGPTTNGGFYRDRTTTLETWGKLGVEGFFKSGDLGQFDKFGNLIIVGRKKDVIIRGGQNIYPVEIEGLLLTLPKIRSVALVSMPDPIMGEKVCAYVVLNPGEELTFEELISFLQEKKIAPYKLPERLEIVAKLPMRGAEKVDKAELQKDLLRKLKKENGTI